MHFHHRFTAVKMLFFTNFKYEKTRFEDLETQGTF
ncbi:hypothetical protein PEDI_45170 [Persicobacter diffluens]|uniref:Uncharacterized protein n=1 Tax=Persicobacter diffluens TaxID=981 RepID=A0AAN4W4L1_9BACT|nr:hypothetical protein PEDI_45170 [Persicobacter diffluens]